MRVVVPLPQIKGGRANLQSVWPLGLAGFHHTFHATLSETAWPLCPDLSSCVVRRCGGLELPEKRREMRHVALRCSSHTHSLVVSLSRPSLPPPQSFHPGPVMLIMGRSSDSMKNKTRGRRK